MLALQMSSCRMGSSTNAERWVSWDRLSKQHAILKMVIISNLVNMSVTAFSSTVIPSFPRSASCTESISLDSWALGENSLLLRRGESLLYSHRIAERQLFKLISQVLLQSSLFFLDLVIFLYVLDFVPLHETLELFAKISVWMKRFLIVLAEVSVQALRD